MLKRDWTNPISPDSSSMETTSPFFQATGRVEREEKEKPGEERQ